VAADLGLRLSANAKLKIFKTEEAQKTLVDGSAHAYMATLTEARFLSLNHPNKIDIPLETPLLTSKTVLAVMKGKQGLLNFHDTWITARDADIWLATSQKYWFNGLEWREQVGQ